MPCYVRVAVTANDERALRDALKEQGLAETDYTIRKRADGSYEAQLAPGIADQWGFGTFAFQQKTTQLATFHRASRIAKMQGYMVTRKEGESGKIEVVMRRY
jgi:hypothetical protein